MEVHRSNKQRPTASSPEEARLPLCYCRRARFQRTVEMGGYRLGVDIGGTFTDLVMLDEATGELRQVKLPSTPRDPSIGFTDVLNRALKESGSSARAITCLIHGTTVATNTIIEGKGAHAALITTEGFRDVRSEEHTSELQSHSDLVCRLLLEKKKKNNERTDKEPVNTQ